MLSLTHNYLVGWCNGPRSYSTLLSPSCQQTYRFKSHDCPQRGISKSIWLFSAMSHDLCLWLSHATNRLLDVSALGIHIHRLSNCVKPVREAICSLFLHQCFVWCNGFADATHFCDKLVLVKPVEFGEVFIEYHHTLGTKSKTVKTLIAIWNYQIPYWIPITKSSPVGRG